MIFLELIFVVFSLTFLSLKLSLLMVVRVSGFTGLTSIFFLLFFFFLIFFKYFHHSLFFYWELCFIFTFLDLLLCGQSKPYDQSYKFWRLKHVNCSLFRSFLKFNFFLYFILEHLIFYELIFMLCFVSFLSMRLFHSCAHGRGVNGLT